jgi:DNA/RNA-binding domain of Phe-tRNA-synthetase-like protein
VVARRWCWRQSEESAAGVSTRQALFTIEAQHAGGRAAVSQALADLQALLAAYVGGEYQSAILP